MHQIYKVELMNLHGAMFGAALLLAGAALSALQANELQAEDLLCCPGVELSPETRKELQELIRTRQELASSLVLEDFSTSQTLFGIRMNLPEKMQEWIEEESRRVEALVPAGQLERVRDYALSMRDLAREHERRYPMKQNVGVGVTQRIRREGEQRRLQVDLTVSADAAEYRMVHESEEAADGRLIIRVTLVRPSPYEVQGKEPQPAEFHAQVTGTGMPKAVEIWTRTIDGAMPLQLTFKLLGSIPLQGGT